MDQQQLAMLRVCKPCRGEHPLILWNIPSLHAVGFRNLLQNTKLWAGPHFAFRTCPARPNGFLEQDTLTPKAYRRIHFGKFVAESKFQQETEKMVKLIKDGDRKGIEEAITNAKVEKKILERLRLKARTYGTDPSIGAQAEGKINVDAVVAMYEV